jgi:hypothetical protein
MKKKNIFCILKVTKERCLIRSWIQISLSEVSGSAPKCQKCHGSPTLLPDILVNVHTVKTQYGLSMYVPTVKIQYGANGLRI